ncbi:cytochrome c oxidase subunit 4 [Ornithinimicrobium sufpigmenti]|uniref:cytochrome c oxidase subunit 4 n=1 Tax=Ornithinimicrobium sufpigmenti TaxID=2508882 RepID=UPI0010365C55|nr:MULTISPECIES: cytochrome c oxidase subunit 4 [unclassified Ornithinimicrobium]
MRTEAKVFAALIPFFGLLTVIYAYFTNFGEWVGIIGLFLTMLFATWIAVYLWLTGRKTDPRPEDDLQGEIADLSGDFGHFTPYSWWPLYLGLSTSVVVLGIGVGWWLAVAAAPFLVISVVGWVFEHFRGEHAI